MKSSKPLDRILANRRWLRRLDPFPHYVVPDVFTPAVAEEISVAVAETVKSENRVEHFGWYDAFGCNFLQDQEWPIRLFMTPAWCDMLAAVAGVRRTRHINGGLHHHAVGSKSGFIHHDLNPVYFAEEEEGRDGIAMARHDLVDYTTGTTTQEGVTVTKEVRAVAMLYYTANEPWSPGDGGETGLYRRATDPVKRPAAKAPPLNNSMLIFRCTPHSYHTFLTNRSLERNSVIMWLHQTFDEAASHWGPGAPMAWKVH